MIQVRTKDPRQTCCCDGEFFPNLICFRQENMCASQIISPHQAVPGTCRPATLQEDSLLLPNLKARGSGHGLLPRNGSRSFGIERIGPGRKFWKVSGSAPKRLPHHHCSRSFEVGAVRPAGRSLQDVSGQAATKVLSLEVESLRIGVIGPGR